MAGTFAHRPLGFILHGSRSGQQWSIAREFDSCRNYAASGAGGLGWTATLGEWAYSVHMDARHWGWHARAASTRRFGLEFAQANLGDPITDGHIDSFVAHYRAEVVPVWGEYDMDDPAVLRTHAEVEHDGVRGAHDGKTDLAPYGDPMADDVRARIRAAL